MSKINRLHIPRHLPAAYEALGQVETVLEGCDLDPLLRHLVKLRVSQINGCAYCVGLHIKEARQDGETNDRLDHIVVWPNTELFDGAEKAALAWAEALTTRGTGANLNDLHDELKTHYRPDQIDALTVVVIMINNWNRLQIANHNRTF